MHVLTDVPLAELTTLRIGGPARRLVEVSTEAEMLSTVAGCDARGEPLLLLGGGSNVVIGDEGFDGTVLRIATGGVEVADDEGGARVRVAAGEPWDALVARAVNEGLVGLEALSGIPGLTGATPVQNVGAYGQEVAQTLEEVRVWDREHGEVCTFSNAECQFRYRHSRFKGTERYVMLEVTFRLQRGTLGAPVRYAELARALGVAVGAGAPLRQVREAVLALRRGKGMVIDPADPDTWSAGSFFTNPVLDAEQAAALPADAPRFPEADGRVKTSAAWLIEHSGFSKGYGTGPARLSTKHTLALTNRGAASAADLLGLAREIRDGVRARYGVELVNEPILVGARL
ncbi:MAG: UDP-N-acetylmuramate dehydrogenase [Actinomycetota bacterium]|nr:UDP-N-acetylmuramate dehydrogenase [Actinomycetota bacterium]